MTQLAPIQFHGEIQANRVKTPVSFKASIDDRGALRLNFDPIVPSEDVYRAMSGSLFVGERIEPALLSGMGPAGPSFSSDSLFFGSWQHEPDKLKFDANCAMADIRLQLEKPVARPRLTWHLRQFQALGPMQATTAVGHVGAQGLSLDADSQKLSGSLAIEAASADHHEHWWDDAERTIDHVARVLSFATGRHLEPYVESRAIGTDMYVRVWSRADAQPALSTPFYFLNLGPIFSAACSSESTCGAALKELDAAVQWFAAPATYIEMEFVALMMAIESVLARAKLKGRLKKKVRDYLSSRSIAVHDFPASAIDEMVDARNRVVHEGIYHDTSLGHQVDLLQHIGVAREIVLRVLLSVIRFEGSYFSPLRRGQIKFPTFIGGG